MRQRKTLLMILTSTILTLSILACVSSNMQGELPASCEAIIIELQGEVDPIWESDVVAGEKYQLMISAHESNYPFYLNVKIWSNEEDGWVLITESGGTNIEEEISIPFIGPDSERIQIKILELTGENGEDLGEISIKLCRDQVIID